MTQKSSDYDAQYTKTPHMVSVPVTVADEHPCYPALPHDKTDLWEETAFALVAESGDYDVLLWTAGYLLKGNGRGVWMHNESVEHDVMFIAVPKSSRGKMQDNHFIRAGWHPQERLSWDKFRFEDKGDEVVWHFDQQQFVAKPPLWQAKGNYAGIEFDLDYRQTGNTLWNWGPFADVASKNRAGYDLFAAVDGSLKVGDRTFEIKDGQGVREHIITGQSNDPVRNLPAPTWMWWLYTIVDGVAINFFRPGQIDIGAVYTGDREIKFNPAADPTTICRYTTLETWHDPRDASDLPVRWHLNMTSKECTVDLEISAHGRAYEFWTTHDGVRKYCYYVCTANGRIWLDDGRQIEVKDHLLLNSSHRTISVRTETLEGPKYIG